MFIKEKSVEVKGSNPIFFFRVKDAVIGSFPFLIGLFIGLWFISRNIIGSHLEFVPGDLGDGRFNLYILEHAFQFITGKVPSYWSAPFMFPAKEVISYSDNLLGTAPFYIFFRFLNLDRETSFQCWYLLITILNYTCCYLFLNWVFRNKYAAVIGALIFSFSMALQVQLVLPQNYTRFPAPLALWCVMLFFEKLNPKYFLLSLLLVVYQIYCGIYLGFMLMIVIALALLVGMIVKYKDFFTNLFSPKFLFQMIGFLIVSIVVLIPLMLPYIKRATHLHQNRYEEIFSTIPMYLSYVYRKKGSILWDIIPDMDVQAPAFWSHYLFPGGMALIGITLFFLYSLYFFIRKEKGEAGINPLNHKIAFWSMVFTFLFFMRFGTFSFYHLIFKLPGFMALRSLCRVINIELLFFAFGCAFLLHLITKKKNTLSRLLFILFLGLFLVDNYCYKNEIYHTDKEKSKGRINNLVQQLTNVEKGSLVSYEPDSINTDIMFYQIDAMLAAQEMGMISVNGYTATSPLSYSNYGDHPNEANRIYWLSQTPYENSKIVILK